jgi:hypothetical protein
MRSSAGRCGIARPTIADWLAWPDERIAAAVQDRQLTVLFNDDGSRRHYLIHTGHAAITDPDDYGTFSGRAHVAIYGMMYDHGVKRIITPMLFPDHFKRGERYIQMAVDLNQRMLLNADFSRLYAIYGVQVRCYGDYATAPYGEKIAAAVRDLAAHTPEGDRFLHFSYYAGSFSAQVAAQVAQGTAPQDDALREACFPPGLEKVDVLITAGPLRVGHLLPPLLDAGTDIYSLSYLPLDLTRVGLRHILYDHLFLRSSDPPYAQYTPEDLAALKAYYAAEKGIAGLGHLVGPGVWHPYGG